MVVNYENEHYPGVIESFYEDGATVSAMIKSLNNWKWPVNKDELFKKWEGIVGDINSRKFWEKERFSQSQIWLIVMNMCRYFLAIAINFSHTSLPII